MDRLLKEKHKRNRRANEVSRSSSLDRSTQKDEMEIDDVNCIVTRRTMVKKGTRMEQRPYGQRSDKQIS